LIIRLSCGNRGLRAVMVKPELIVESSSGRSVDGAIYFLHDKIV